MGGIKEPYREVAAALLVGPCGRLLYQQRDDIPGLLYAGMVSLFGGHREGSETPLETVRREIEEETGLALGEAQLEKLLDLNIAYPAGGGVKGSYFIARGVEIEGREITEGQGLIVSRSELPGLLSRMSPTACLATRFFLELPEA